MNEDGIREKIHSDPLFINAKRFDYNMQNLKGKFPDGCPDHVISDVLMISEEEMAAEMDVIVAKLRTSMGVT